MDLQQPWPLSRPPRTSAHGCQQYDHRELRLGSRVSLSGQNSRCPNDCPLVRLILVSLGHQGKSFVGNYKMHELYFTARKSAVINLTKELSWGGEGEIRT